MYIKLKGNGDIKRGAEKRCKKYYRKIKREQLKIFTKLKFEYKRNPLRKEWEEKCKNEGIPFRTGTKYGFKGFYELKEKALYFNHRIANIEYCGKETVYNGTVDEFHNFYFGGFEGKQSNEKKQWTFLNNRQCGELPLCKENSCLLFVLNLTKFVNSPFSSKPSFNKEKFEYTCRKAAHLMDDMVDLEIEKVHRIINKIKADPEDELTKSFELNLWENVKKTLSSGRRVGLGFTGFGDMLAMLNIKYDSNEAIKFTEELGSLFHFTLMDEQATLAKERGSFKAYDWEKEKNCIYNTMLPDEVKNRIKRNGRRNISITTCSPSGTISLLTQTTSGIEPVFKLEYVRRKKVTDDELKSNKELKYTIDDDGIKWVEFKIEHHGLKMWKDVTGENDSKKSPYFNCDANSINWKQRIKIQSTWQKYITASISNTYNLPADITKEEVSKIYIEAWKHNCKGITIYREGSRDGVLIDKKNSKKIDKDIVLEKVVNVHAPKRPKILPCDIHYSSIQDKHKEGKMNKWIFFVSTVDGRPYEIFGGKKDNIEIPQKYKNGWISKNGKNDKGMSTYDLYLGTIEESDERMVIKDIISMFQADVGSYTRLISTQMRHGIPIYIVCEQLMKDSDASLFCFEKSVARVLKKYIKDDTVSSGACEKCKQKTLVYKDGCCICASCGWSMCS